MKMRSYIKVKDDKKSLCDKPMNMISSFIQKMAKRKIYCSIAILVVCLSVVGIFTVKHMFNTITISSSNFTHLTAEPVAASSSRGVITIPAGTVKANPFVPYRNIDSSLPALDVPSVSLIAPPEVINEGSDAARVMDTIVSGILYDKYSPSAILNIEGNDYLVKKGDVVNNYKVVNIAQDSVTVKLGANVYKAGIGEILTEGSLNKNTVSNLNNKFGGKK